MTTKKATSPLSSRTISLLYLALNNLSDSRLSFILTMFSALLRFGPIFLGFLHCHCVSHRLPWDWIFIALLILNKPRTTRSLMAYEVKTRFTTVPWCLLPSACSIVKWVRHLRMDFIESRSVQIQLGIKLFVQVSAGCHTKWFRHSTRSRKARHAGCCIPFLYKSNEWNTF